MVYDQNGLRIGQERPFSTKDRIAVVELDGVWWQNGNAFLTTDLSSSSPSIGGVNNRVDIYSPSSEYNLGTGYQPMICGLIKLVTSKKASSASNERMEATPLEQCRLLDCVSVPDGDSELYALSLTGGDASLAEGLITTDSEGSFVSLKAAVELLIDAISQLNSQIASQEQIITQLGSLQKGDAGTIQSPNH